MSNDFICANCAYLKTCVNKNADGEIIKDKNGVAKVYHVVCDKTHLSTWYFGKCEQHHGCHGTEYFIPRTTEHTQDEWEAMNAQLQDTPVYEG